MKDVPAEVENHELEKQLSCPEGAFGIEVGKEMNKTNFGMNSNSIKALEIKDYNSVLDNL